MLKKLLTIMLVAAVAMSSCKKETTQPVTKIAIKSTGQIVVPTGFNWQNSRNLNIKVSIVDATSATAIHVVSIYDNDPAAGGNLISKGAASTLNPYKGKINLSNQIATVFVVNAYANGSRITQKVTAGTAHLNISIGK